jgi:acyl-CoA thioesterase-2
VYQNTKQGDEIRGRTLVHLFVDGIAPRYDALSSRTPEEFEMNDARDEIVRMLELEEVVEDRYVGQSTDLGWGRLFGGHVLAQALSSASRTVPQQWLVHSLHAYFLRPGAVDAQILYEVDRIRDGRSFTTRRVVARQRGEVILNLSASFHREEQGFEHQLPMPDVPGPDQLRSELDLRREVVDKIPEAHRERWLRERPIETRPVETINFLEPEVRDPVRHLWFRTRDSVPDDPARHRWLLAYASDFALLGTALLPHRVPFMGHGMLVTSLDHAMWFHRDCRVDDWLLYAMDSPSASNAVGFNRGSIFNRDGVMVASVAQEALIRRRTKPQEEITS